MPTEEHSSWAYRKARDRLKAQHLQPCVLCSDWIDYALEAPHPMRFAAEHVIAVRHGGSWRDGLLPSHVRCQNKQGGEYIGGKFDPDYVPRDQRPPTATRAQKQYEAIQRTLLLCICGELYTPDISTSAGCTPECSAERNARRARDAYRLKQGLSVDPDLPTSMMGKRGLNPPPVTSGVW